MLPRLAAALLAAIALRGCLTYEYEHEIWLQVNGSGTVNVTGPPGAVDRAQEPAPRRERPRRDEEGGPRAVRALGARGQAGHGHEAGRPPLPLRLGGLQGREPHLLHPRLPRPAGGAAARGRAAPARRELAAAHRGPSRRGGRPRGAHGRSLPPAEQGLRPPARRRRGRARQHPRLAAGDGAGPRRRAPRVRGGDGRAEHPLLDGDALRGSGGPRGRPPRPRAVGGGAPGGAGEDLPGRQSYNPPSRRRRPSRARS